MSVLEALQYIESYLMGKSGCGRLEGTLNEARIILHKFVIDKLAEDKDNGKENE